MSFKELFDLSNSVLELRLTNTEVLALVRNNEFFLTQGILAIEISKNSSDGLTWNAFRDHWWRRLMDAGMSAPTCLEVARLGYLVYSYERYGVSPLPPDIETLAPLPRCSFPLCSRTDDLEEDHIWPVSLGGPGYQWNLQNLCGFHNRIKSNFPGLNFCDPAPLREALVRAYP